MFTLVTDPLKKCFNDPRVLFSVSRSSSVNGISLASNHSARATIRPVLPTPPLPPIVKTTRLFFASAFIAILLDRRDLTARSLQSETLGLCLLVSWPCFQRCDSSGNVVRVYRDRVRFRSEWRKFVLNPLPVFGTNLDEGVDCADGYVKADPLAKNADDVAIGATLPSQLANQFAMSFEFGARWILRDRIQQGKKGRVHDFQAPYHLAITVR